jgi:hypothetical protein
MPRGEAPSNGGRGGVRGDARGAGGRRTRAPQQRHYQITHANVTETLATNAGAALLEERDRLRAALESATHACDLAHNPTGHNRDHVNETLLRALQKAREALE